MGSKRPKIKKIVPFETFQTLFGVPHYPREVCKHPILVQILISEETFILCILAPFWHITLLLEASKGPQPVLLVNEDGPEFPYMHLVGPKLHLGALIYSFPKSYFLVFLGVSRSKKKHFLGLNYQDRAPKICGPNIFLETSHFGYLEQCNGMPWSISIVSANIGTHKYKTLPKNIKLCPLCPFQPSLGEYLSTHIGLFASKTVHLCYLVVKC